MIAPALSFVALFILSVARKNGYPLLPINATILTSWLCMSLIVTFIVMLQPEPVRRQIKGTTYMVMGAVTGLAVGLLGFTVSDGISLLYSMMMIGVAIGIVAGLLLYSRTPDGFPIAPGSGNFFRYLLSKGFPIAITVMQGGVALVLTIAVMHN